MNRPHPLSPANDEFDLERLKALLADYPALTENADQHCWDMLAGARLQRFDPDTVLFYQGMECTHLMLIVEGCVRVFRDSDDGREITLYRVEPGQLCIHNLNNLVDGVHSQITAKTESPMRGLVISKNAFHEAMDNSRSFRNYVLRTLTERLSLMTNLVSGFAFDRLDLRVAVWLIQQFDRTSGRPIQATHSDIAHELGTTREMISRILKDFEHKRCIQLARGKIHLICKHTLHLASKSKGKSAV